MTWFAFDYRVNFFTYKGRILLINFTYFIILVVHPAWSRCWTSRYHAFYLEILVRINLFHSFVSYLFKFDLKQFIFLTVMTITYFIFLLYLHLETVDFINKFLYLLFVLVFQILTFFELRLFRFHQNHIRFLQLFKLFVFFIQFFFILGPIFRSQFFF